MIRTPNYPEDLPAIKELYTAYALSLNLDLSFQDFETELSSLPGNYAPENGGSLLLAVSTKNNEAIACVALRSLGADGGRKICEMKRLHCSPASRGLGVGRALAERIIEIAEGLGYDEMKLDTLPEMERAIKLYQSLGFVEIEAYYYNPIERAIYLSKKLR